MRLLQLHLKEIQYRCTYVGLAYLFSFVDAFETADIYLHTLLQYAGIEETQCTYIGEAFNVSLVIALMIALIFTLPYGVYMVQSYIRPGKRRTPRDQRLYTLRVSMRELVTLSIGGLAVFYILKGVPFVIHYFLSYADGLQAGFVHHEIHTQPRLLPTVYFTLRMCLTLLWIFMCILLIMRYNEDKLSNLHTRRYTFRPYAYVLVLLFASIIAPPEGYLQFCITCILFFILEISIFMAMYNQVLKHV